MAEDYSYRPSTVAPTSGKLRTALIIALTAFVLGVIGTGYLAYRAGFDFGGAIARQETSAPLPVLTVPSPSPSADQAVAQAAQAVERVAEQQGGIDQRVAAMEQRLARLDLQSQAAAGNAARAEGLLIAFATRRALERGAPLGYLADQLTLRFGDAQPNAVRTVITVANNPITLDQLLARLEGLAPRLASSPQAEDALPFLRRQLSELFVVRRETVASPQPERRLERARLFLESGRIDAAVAEVRNLPNAAEAGAWIADAERYAQARVALDRIETTAILEPRTLRDGAGNRVAQPSPAAGN
jgi:hypothetical protein